MHREKNQLLKKENMKSEILTSLRVSASMKAKLGGNLYKLT